MQKIYSDKIVKRLANLQFAIGLLFSIVIASAIGTIIEQNQDLTFYQSSYSENHPILGFITWKLIIFFGFDHVYTSPFFTFLLAVLAASLLSCTLSVQLPVLRQLRRWKFYTDIKNIDGIKNKLSTSTTNLINFQLHKSDYSVFRQGRKSYAYSGLIGRFGPIVVHASLVLFLIGSTLGQFGGYIAQEFCPRGEIFHIQNLIKSGKFNILPQNLSWRINDFWITYSGDLKVNQFYSDLSVLDSSGNELKRKVVFVNEPLIYKGVTIYQTDWNIEGLKIDFSAAHTTKQLTLKKVKNSGPLFWIGKFRIQVSPSQFQSFSILCKDLSGRFYVFNENGNLVEQVVIGQPLFLANDVQITISEILTATGLQIKIDPGLNIIYLAFFLLIISTYISFISYSQLWGIENGRAIEIAGKSNRAVLFFQSQLRQLVKQSSS